MNTESKNSPAPFSPFRNWLCLLGMLIALGSLFSFILLFAIDLVAKETSPYLGILTFVVAPIFLVIGMLVYGLGWLWHRRSVTKMGAAPFLSIDFSRVRDRRYFGIFVAGSFVFFIFAAIGSYNSYHFAESERFCGQTCHTPMRPEHVTYLNSPHAQVSCTECHVGPGAASFVKAKLNGVNQLKATLLNNFHRPIHMPDHLRPTRLICEQCHWPKKEIGNLERTYTHYLSDETNTATSFRMMLKVGGGDPTQGPVPGIHWHTSLGTKVEYISTNENRQVIPWVRMTDAQGKATVFTTKDFKEDPAKYAVHTMDCMDCHNRPAHQFQVPNEAVDVAMSRHKIDPAIPLIKSNVVAVLTRTNFTHEAQALDTIASVLQAAYPKEPRLAAAISEAQQIYRNNFFPEMKADWRSYPDNSGHKYWPGCFRCHDGQHQTQDGTRKLQSSSCDDCHLILGQGTAVAAIDKLTSTGVKFVHPDSSSEATDADCFSCHASSP